MDVVMGKVWKVGIPRVRVVILVGEMPQKFIKPELHLDERQGEKNAVWRRR